MIDSLHLREVDCVISILHKYYYDIIPFSGYKAITIISILHKYDYDTDDEARSLRAQFHFNST